LHITLDPNTAKGRIALGKGIVIITKNTNENNNDNKKENNNDNTNCNYDDSTSKTNEDVDTAIRLKDFYHYINDGYFYHGYSIKNR
jgi:hypothetical protein